MVSIKESIGRQAVLALANQYTKVSEAVQELVDNPFDYRRGRKLYIDVSISKNSDEISVFDRGGEGMDADGLSGWIRWGEGPDHALTDIGQYRVGGKLAAVYLGESIEIITRRSGKSDIVRFYDPHWGSRTDLFVGEVEEINEAHVAWRVKDFPALKPDEGFTFVQVSGLRKRRVDISNLKEALGDVYRHLIRSNDCVVRINGEHVSPLEIPEATSIEPVDIPATKLGGVTVRGRVWATNRDRLAAGKGVSLKAGVRTIFNGRLITDGEGFGHNLSGKGNLQRLAGEVHISQIRPNTNKTNWDRDLLEWRRVEKFMKDQMAPVIEQLRKLSESSSISREQRKRGEDVRRRVQRALAQLQSQEYSDFLGDLGSQNDRPGGRKPATSLNAADRSIQSDGQIIKRPTKNRTTPPSNAVGKLLRRFSGSVPPMDYDRLGESERSQWRTEENGEKTIVINTDFPMFQKLGDTPDYLADTFVSRMLDEDHLDGAELTARVDRILWLALKDTN